MIKYLSPTTFIKFHKQCEWRIYLEKIKKVIPDDVYRAEQTMAQATGIAVDIMIKGALNRRINIEQELGREILSKNESSILLAKEIFEAYNHGPLQALKKEGVGFGCIDQEVEIEWEEYNNPPPIQINSVENLFIAINTASTLHSQTRKSILYGKPDMTLTTGEVIDFKCQGMWGRGKRPNDGYIRCWIFGKHHPQNGKDIGSSPKGDDNIPLEQINEDWAIQLYLYNRLLGHKPGNQLRAGIENICVEYKPYPTIWCASFRNQITSEFQLTIEKAFHNAFTRLNTATPDNPNQIELPCATPYRCVTYGKVCPCSPYCSSYQSSLRK